MRTEKQPTAAEVALADYVANLTQRWEETEERLNRSLEGVRLRGAEFRPVNTIGTTTLASSNGSLVGFGLREASGVAGVLIEFRNQNGNGDLILPVKLAPGASLTEWFSDGGIAFTDGLALVVVSGQIAGSAYLQAGGRAS